MNDPSIANAIKAEAKRLGFDLVGIAPAEPSAWGDQFRKWLADGNAGTMGWLEKRVDERLDPGAYFPGVKSVICVAMNYYTNLAPSPGTPGEGRGEGDFERQTITDILNHSHPNPLPGYRERGPENTARIARYALGTDYHEVIQKKLHQLADWLVQQVPGTQTRCGVDTAPIAERELAARAGIGWIGKNTCVISPKIGSWILLGEVLTTLELPADVQEPDHCGTCRRCLDACPTGALTEHHLDARKCISYLTIEHRDELSEQQIDHIGDWLFGCDICQDVCPWNHRAPEASEPAFAPRFPGGSVALDDVLAWRPKEHNPLLSHSAIKRVKLNVLQRNARAILEKSVARAD